MWSEIVALLDFIRAHPPAAVLFAFLVSHCSSLTKLERALHRLAVFNHRVRLIWRKAKSEPNPRMSLPE